MTPTAAADPVTGLGTCCRQPFIQHALLAGTAIALLSGLVGYFVVLRGQVFAGDALSHVAYTGALAALAAGVDLRFGLFVATVVVGLLLGVLGGRAGGRRRRHRHGVRLGARAGRVLPGRSTPPHARTGNSAANVNVLFGSIFGISGAGARAGGRASPCRHRWLLVGDRPAAAVRQPRPGRGRGPRGAGPLARTGVPGRWSGSTAAEASQAVGALLLFALLAAPPAAAQRLTDRPWPALALAGGLSVLALWLGIAVQPTPGPRLPPASPSWRSPTAEYLLAAGWAVPPACTGRRRRLRPAGRTGVPGAGGAAECSGHSPKSSTVWLMSV